MMQLPSNEISLWRTFYAPTGYPQLKDQIDVDVVVIGAGITGLTTAYLLKQAGQTVAVIEKDTVAGGTSGRTTGKVTSQHGTNYSDLAERLNRDVAMAYGDVNQAAIELVEKIIKTERISCDWERDDNYVFTADPSKVAEFKHEADVAAQLGLPATFESTLPLPFEVKGAVKFSNQAKMNTQKYLLGLAKAVHGNGSYVFEHSNVNGIRDGMRCRTKTKHGTVHSKVIVVATNVPTMPLIARGGYCILEYPTESFIVSGPLNQDITGMYISPDSNHYSILPITVEGIRQLLIGGQGGNLPGLNPNKSKRYQKLANYARENFGVDSITNTWGDRDYIAYDNLPLVGNLYPWSKNLYVGTAFRKWGLSNGTAAATMLRDLIVGNPNKYAAHFTPIRSSAITSIPHGVKQYLKS